MIPDGYQATANLKTPPPQSGSALDMRPKRGGDMKTASEENLLEDLTNSMSDHRRIDMILPRVRLLEARIEKLEKALEKHGVL